MGTIHTDGHVSVTRVSRFSKGMSVTTHKDDLDAVLSMINSGSLGATDKPGDLWWGSATHRAAVQKVIDHAIGVLNAIDAENAKEKP